MKKCLLVFFAFTLAFAVLVKTQVWNELLKKGQNIGSSVNNALKERAYFGFKNHILENNETRKLTLIKIVDWPYYYKNLRKVWKDPIVKQANVYFGAWLPFRGGVTFGSDIYISMPFADKSVEICILLAHELAHVVQYNSYGSTKKFAHAYLKGVGAHTLKLVVQSKWSFRKIHHKLALEQEARVYEKRMEKYLGITKVKVHQNQSKVVLKNSTREQVSICLCLWKGHDWEISGWYKIDPSKELVFDTGFANRFFFYAQTKKYTWQGKHLFRIHPGQSFSYFNKWVNKTKGYRKMIGKRFLKVSFAPGPHPFVWEFKTP